MPWKHLPDSPAWKKAWFSVSLCPRDLPQVLHSPQRGEEPLHSQRCCGTQHGTLHDVTLTLPLSPSLPWYPSCDGPAGSSFGLPFPALHVPYPCCIPMPSGPTYQLCGSVPQFHWVQPCITMLTQKILQPCCMGECEHQHRRSRFNQGCCHHGPTGSESSFFSSL